MKSVVQRLFEKSFLDNQQRNALWIKGRYYTYGQLAQKVNAILPLLNATLGKRKPVAIITHDEPETYAAIIAAIISGAGFVPISPSFPVDRGCKIIELSGAVLLLCGNESDVSSYLGRTAEIYCISGLLSGLRSVEASEIADTSSFACILFTSGSTGEPKGVPMSYKNIDTSVDSFLSLNYGIAAESRCLQMFEFTFDMSLIAYLPAFLSGACVYSIVDDKMRFFSAFKIMKDFNLTFAVFVPSTLAFMRKYFMSVNIPSLRCCLVGGEPFALDLAFKWMQCAPNARVINISGPTETTMACMGYEVKQEYSENKTLNGILAFGKPWKNTVAIVVNEDLEILSSGERGELCFAGENVMSGYINNSNKNRDVFFTKTIRNKEYSFYRTGDGAYFDSDGDYFTCGRIDLQVKIQGYRVEPGEIEGVARMIAGNRLLAAIPYKKHDGFYAIRLFIEDAEDFHEEMMNFLIQKLPGYMIPDEITSIPSMPLSLNGKVDRNYLKRMIEDDKR